MKNTISRARAYGEYARPFVWRNEYLRLFEGSYTIEDDSIFKTNINLRAWKESGTKMKATRWISRKFPELDQAYLSELGKLLEASRFTFTFSYRHKDILRASETPHYNSCYAVNSPTGNGQQLLHYCNDPDIAIVFVRDASGKFLARQFVRLMKDENGQIAFYFQRKYGESQKLIAIEKWWNENVGAVVREDYWAGYEARQRQKNYVSYTQWDTRFPLHYNGDEQLHPKGIKLSLLKDYSYAND